MEADTNEDANSKQNDERTCSLYISRVIVDKQPFPHPSSKASLEEAIAVAGPTGDWHVHQTACGLIAAFSDEADAEKLVQRVDLAHIFQGPVQVARFSAHDARYRQSVFLRDVPWAIPLEDLTSALAKQGISIAIIERCRQYVRVEVLDANHYELLLRQGLDFFGAARFSALPERAYWYRSGGDNSTNSGTHQFTFSSGNGNNDGSSSQQPDGVLQCYRCQGFWHVAASCRHLPRCVRCGGPHSVEFCPRPRNNPICCHCSGPHHAGFRQCPVRLQLLNATPISITLTTNRAVGQYPSNPVGKCNVPQSQQVPTPNH